jgi:hypothetical protein
MRASTANNNSHPLRERGDDLPTSSYDKPVRKGYTEFFSWGNDEDG